MAKLVCAVLFLAVGVALARGEHPRLFFTANDLPALRERASTTHRKYAEAARTLFEWEAASPPALPTTPKTIDAWPIEPWTARMVNASFLWAATGDEAALAEARKWLAGLCRCRAAADNSYTYGFYALALATAYDVLHTALSPEERRAVREHLGAVCQGLYESAIGRARGWWRRIYLHHDYWIPTAGLGVAALALKDEDQRWRTWYDLARRELTLALSLLGEDGAWHEGVAGWCYGLAVMLPFVEASRNVLGDDLYRFAWLRNTARWRLHCRLPDGSCFFYGDSFREGRYHGLGSTPSHLLRLLAARFRDGHAQWLAEREEASDFAQFEQIRAERKPGAAPPRASQMTAFYAVGWNLIWFDPTLRPVPPEALPTHRVFDNLGYVVARTGWGPEAAVLSFRAGPVAGQLGREAALRLGASFVQRMDDSAEHAHMDQNAITYFADGTYWLSPPGYGARNSARHTTLVINGRQQQKDSRIEPRLLRREFADDYVYLLGDASSAYPADVGLARLHRHVLWLKPDVLVICDDVRTEKPATVEWRLHPYRKLPPPEAKGNRIVLRASGDASAPGLGVEFLSPEALTLVGHTKEPIEEELHQRKSKQRLLQIAYGVARTNTPAARHLFLVTLGPAAGVKAKRLAVEGGAGALIETTGRPRAVIFSLEPLCGAQDVRLSYTVPGPEAAPHFLVGLPAAVGLSVTETSTRDGSVTVAIAPGTAVQTSFEGTLSLH